MINKILRTDLSNPNKLVAGYEIVDEEPEEINKLTYNEEKEC